MSEADPVAPASGIDGFLLIDKPSGLTSQHAVSRVKRTLGVRKAGHAGTLDPMATGLLVVGLGKATRLLGYFADKDKQYRATIRFGQATTTDDAEGTPLGDPVDATALTRADLAAAVPAYIGQIEQVPSTVSAIKVDGRRAYDLARAGLAVELKPRLVTVTRFTVDEYRPGAGWLDVDVTVECSAGTYIRALARDLGRDLGVGAHLTALRRTRSGQLDVADAVILDEVSANDVEPLARMAELVAPRVDVDESAARAAAVGRTLDCRLPGELATVFSGPDLLGLYRRDPDDPNRARPVRIFAEPAAIGDGRQR